MKIAIGSDHAGFPLKEAIRKYLEEKGIEYIDCGVYDTASADYPVQAKKTCEKIISGECERGILCCGTGIGISMAANKIKGIRAACCSDYFSAKYTPEYHFACFEALAAELHNSTERCVISFMYSYRNTKRNAQQLGAIESSSEELYDFAGQLAKIAAKYGLKLQTCAESMDLTALGITSSACIDKALLEDIGGFELDVKKDANQRAECCCAASIDIGAYNTCPGGCLYCYANYNAPLVQTNIAAHDKTSQLLFCTLKPQDVVTERKMKSCKIMTNSVF